MFFLALLRLQISSFHSEKILLFPSGPNYQAHKKIFPLVSELCIHCYAQSSIPKEKRSGRVFCGCWLPNLLFLLLCETLLSNDFPTNLKYPFYFRKFKIMTKALVVMKRKINQCIFLESHSCNYPVFTGEKCFFFHQSPIPRFTKTFFLQFQSYVKTLLAFSYSFSNFEPMCCSMKSWNCCFLTCIQIYQKTDNVV